MFPTIECFSSLEIINIFSPFDSIFPHTLVFLSVTLCRPTTLPFMILWSPSVIISKP